MRRISSASTGLARHAPSSKAVIEQLNPPVVLLGCIIAAGGPLRGAEGFVPCPLPYSDWVLGAFRVREAVFPGFVGFAVAAFLGFEAVSALGAAV